MRNPEDDLFTNINDFLKKDLDSPWDTTLGVDDKKRLAELSARLSTLVNKMRITLQETIDENVVFEDPSLPKNLLLSQDTLPSGPTRTSIAMTAEDIPPVYDIDHISLHSFDGTSSQECFSPLQSPLFYLPHYFDLGEPLILVVGTSTDTVIQGQIDTLIGKGEILRSSVYQTYIFNQNGRCGHVSSFPRTVLDTRADIGHPESSIKHVHAPMSKFDITTAETSTALLEAALQ